MEKVKKLLYKLLPIRLYNQLRLFRYSKTANKSFKSAELEIDQLYYKMTGTHINWNDPRTYTEKMNYVKLYGANSYKAQLTDKYCVREWIKEKIGEEYLIPILGVYDSFEDINFDELPNAFVMKCNHDSASVFLCKDKSKINKDRLRSEYEFYLKRNYAYMTGEMHYKNIPHKIIIEKYMGEDLNDYKFLCFHGKPYFCWVDLDRFENHKRNIYDLEWNLQPFRQYSYSNEDETKVKKPEQFQEMITIAEILCEGFDHVRVDLYLINNQIYFGEMTFTNGSGTETITPPEWDKKLGDLWNLDTSLRDRVFERDKLKLKNYDVK